MIDFELLWSKYPMRVGKKMAKKHFESSVKTEQDWLDIQKALKNYHNHLACNEWKKPQNGSTWFNNYEDWINWKEPGFEDTPTYIRQAT